MTGATSMSKLGMAVGVPIFFEGRRVGSPSAGDNSVEAAGLSRLNGRPLGSPSCPLLLEPNANTESSLGHRSSPVDTAGAAMASVWRRPVAMSTTWAPRRPPSTRLMGETSPEGVRRPWPSCPKDPSPPVSSWPASLMKAVWAQPAATLTILVPKSPGTGAGMGTEGRGPELGAELPVPPRPQVTATPSAPVLQKCDCQLAVALLSARGKWRAQDVVVVLGGQLGTASQG
mmetsp:Transcript_8047/g.23053  ORF Transcript_8047/g.23053 Transcript_8047/m.23053 type:complete len:230 (+) Transcript_8047:611-1300(+)